MPPHPPLKLSSCGCEPLPHEPSPRAALKREVSCSCLFWVGEPPSSDPSTEDHFSMKSEDRCLGPGPLSQLLWNSCYMSAAGVEQPITKEAGQKGASRVKRKSQWGLRIDTWPSPSKGPLSQWFSPRGLTLFPAWARTRWAFREVSGRPCGVGSKWSAGSQTGEAREETQATE